MRGFVYILTCEAMPGLIKVGMTTRGPWERASELSRQTGLPAPYQVARAFPVFDVNAAEVRSHEVLQEHRYSENREFFRCAADFAACTLHDCFEKESHLDVEMCVDAPSTKEQLRQTLALLDAAQARLEGVSMELISEHQATCERAGDLEARLAQSEQAANAMKAQLDIFRQEAANGNVVSRNVALRAENKWLRTEIDKLRGETATT